MDFFSHLDLPHVKYAFYDLLLNNKGIAEDIQKEIKPLSAQNLLVIGNVGVARELMNKGFFVTIFAMSDEMKNYARKQLPTANVIVGDVKNSNFREKFDSIICLGDTLSHIVDDRDVHMALANFHKMLKYGGVILLENLTASKVLENTSENIITKVENNDVKIKRTSSLKIVGEKPPTALWKVTYELMQNGQRNIYEENFRIRGFTENEIERFLKATNFELVKFLTSQKGNNFVTIARK